MAKRKQDTEEDAKDRAPSIGQMMSSKLTQRDRNLAIKKEMVERGERKAPKVSDLRTQRERNLYLKNANKKNDEKEKPKEDGNKSKR